MHPEGLPSREWGMKYLAMLLRGVGVNTTLAKLDGNTRARLDAEVEALLSELVRGFATHLYMARQEVEQTRAILDDAVMRLMPMFTAFRHSIAGKNGEVHPGLAPELADVARAALPAMQFHDISSQLLAHIQVRFDTFLTELERLSGGIRDASTASGQEELAGRLAVMRVTLAENMAALDRKLRKPVSQDNMASGEIELF